MAELAVADVEASKVDAELEMPSQEVCAPAPPQSILPFTRLDFEIYLVGNF